MKNLNQTHLTHQAHQLPQAKNNLLSLKYLNAYLPPLLWAGLIFWLSAQSHLPAAPEPMIDLVFKQAAHSFVYGVLAFLIARGTKLTNSKPPTPAHALSHHLKTKLSILAVVFLYALSDELHQAFVPGRTPAWIDIGFDILGASLVLFSFPA